MAAPALQGCSRAPDRDKLLDIQTFEHPVKGSHALGASAAEVMSRAHTHATTSKQEMIFKMSGMDTQMLLSESLSAQAQP